MVGRMPLQGIELRSAVICRSAFRTKSASLISKMVLAAEFAPSTTSTIVEVRRNNL
jgi:hypothetical protein